MILKHSGFCSHGINPFSCINLLFIFSSLPAAIDGTFIFDAHGLPPAPSFGTLMQICVPIVPQLSCQWNGESCLPVKPCVWKPGEAGASLLAEDSLGFQTYGEQPQARWSAAKSSLAWLDPAWTTNLGTRSLVEESVVLRTYGEQPQAR